MQRAAKNITVIRPSMLSSRTLMRLGVAMLLAGGCLVEDEDSDTAGNSATQGTSDASTTQGSETQAEETEATSAASESSSGSSSGGASVPWVDVACGMEMCAGTEVCVQPESYCSGPCVDNYQDLITPPPACQPFPESCDPADPGGCLAGEYCGLSEFWTLIEEDGFLRCESAGGDCYCR